MIRSNILVGVSALALAVAACGKKEKDEGKQRKKPPKDIKAKAKPLTDLIKKGAPGLFGPVSGVTIGGNFDEEKKKAGNGKMFSRDGEDFFDWGGDSKGGIRFTVNRDKKRNVVESVEVEFARHTKVRETLVAAWGSPIEASHFTMKSAGGRTKVLYWFNPAAGLRAYYYQESDKVGDQKQLMFERYQPIDKLLGPGDAMAFETAPILGKTEKEIQAAYKDYDPQFGISMIPVDWNPRFTQAFVRFDKEGKAKNYRIPLRTEFYGKAKEAYLAVLEKKFGKPTIEKGKVDKLVFRKDAPKVVAYWENDVLSITVGEP